MKRIFTFLILSFSVMVGAQNLLTNGSFENWTDGAPDGWKGSKTNLAASNIQESSDAQDGSKSVALIREASGHQRFTSQPLDLEPDTNYTLTFWIKGEGDIRGGFFNGDEDGGGAAYKYGDYNAATGSWQEVTYFFSTDENNYTDVQVIFSLKSTGPDGILVDNAYLSGGEGPEVVDVANVSELRAGLPNGTIYHLTGEAIMTFKQANRNQKYFQDTTGGILIDDATGVLADYEIGDGVTGLTGTITHYNQLVQFVPSEDAGAATSSGNNTDAETVTLADYLADPVTYESYYIVIPNLTVHDDPDGDGTFQTGKNYDMTEGSNTVVGRTNFFDIPLIGTDIPNVPVYVFGFGARFNDTIQLFILDVDEEMGVSDLNSLDLNMTTVWTNQATFAVKGFANVEIYNLNSQLVQKASGNNTFNLNVSSLEKGVYVVKVTVDGKTVVRKAVKK